MNEKRNRSNNLLDNDIASIVSILDGWSEKLTWDSLIDMVEFRMKQRYTRQTLAKHSRIKSAYDLTKKRIINKTLIEIKEPKVNDNILIQKINRLEAENTRLTKENEAFLTQFARWAYNAYIKGITQDELDNALPRVNRRQDT